MPISLPPAQHRPIAQVKFQGTPTSGSVWFNKLDKTLQDLYTRRVLNKKPTFKLDLPVAIYIHPGKLTGTLTQRIKDLSLQGRSAHDRAVAKNLFDHTNVPGAPEAGKMLIARFRHIDQLKTVAKMPAVERVQDSSYWAPWDK